MSFADGVYSQGVGCVVNVACVFAAIITHFAFPGAVPWWAIVATGIALHITIVAGHHARKK